MVKKVLYIGNDLSLNTKYKASLSTLSGLLIKEGFDLVISSDKTSKVLRLLDMSLCIIKNRKKINYILIDTFSTSAFYYCLITSQIARVFKLKYIPILHGGNLPSRLNKSNYFSKLIFSNSYKNIAPSNYLKFEFEKKGFMVEYIPNIISIDNYLFKERKKMQPNLLFVRAFSKEYNVKMAVDVLNELKKSFNDAKLCIIGPDRDGSKKEIELYIKQKGLNKNIEITGVLSKKEWHKKSKEFDIFINTTNIDNTPVSVIEAMALGLPIVSTNVGGIPYLLKDKVDGILVEKGNVNQMVNSIKKILNNNYPKLQVNARKKAESFSWLNNRSKWLKALS
ncbi:glycosyltransferase involved in cell wall biosynthesis [Lutibacter sp. Hel_I_33_5]|uniref:glycosyltransferase family 4 protein n=1 Tax=Lutibacter sp. Hel_I_33_5 TaxID=1566289 RepID=UPI0011ACE030|nr:glycosyltransferase [Lutibacter sp. Hel_I_33_5]TVZ54872.1 glycosyltransferase involved in cell wall biosynthesis [Lutibacter sp. Hel_I_33_5]